jgi:hypothetical protein
VASPGLTAALKANCTVCGSAFRVKVNSEISRGLSQRGIAHRYGLSKDAIRRHTNSRHPGVRVEEDEAMISDQDRESPDEKTPRQKLEAVIRGLESQKVGGSYRVDVARELRIAYSELDKMVSGGRAATAESYRDLEGWSDLEAKIFAALKDHPEALRAVAEALGERA